jgi:hypothetical protein
VKAALALTHLAASCQHRIGEGADLLFGLAQQMQGQPLGGARSDARQSLELVDQPGQGSGETAQGRSAGAANLGTQAVASAQWWWGGAGRWPPQGENALQLL